MLPLPKAVMKMKSQNVQSILNKSGKLLRIHFAIEKKKIIYFVYFQFFRCPNWPKCDQDVQSFYDFMRSTISYPNQSPNCMPILNRAIDGALNPYLTTSDDRLIEYGFIEMVFDQSSGKTCLKLKRLKN